MNRAQSCILLSRGGIARVSVLVVLGICGLLGTLFSAAIVRAREDSRRLQCSCRCRMISLAVQNYSSLFQALPPLTGVISTEVGSEHDERGEMRVPWLIPLLPALDRTKLLEKIRATGTFELKAGEDEGQERGPCGRGTLGFISCPDGVPRVSGLSYVVNSGFIARELYHADPERKHRAGSLNWIAAVDDGQGTKVQLATGIFWHDRSVSMDDIGAGDGTSVTLMLTENLQAGRWFDVETTQIAFAFPVTNIEGRVPVGANAIFESAGRPLQTRSAQLRSYQPHDWRINDNRDAKTGTRPRPSSKHYRPGVNAMMCDGSGRYINQNIDPQVYLKLMTWNGAAFGEQPLNPSQF